LAMALSQLGVSSARHVTEAASVRSAFGAMLSYWMPFRIHGFAYAVLLRALLSCSVLPPGFAQWI
jgi:hypothetical protein